SSVALTRITQFALLVWASKVLIHRKEEWLNLFTYWALTTTICSIFMLLYLIKGEPGFLLFWAIGGDAPTIQIDRIDIFFRVVFFYTNFFIPLGLSIIFAVIAGSRNL